MSDLDETLVDRAFGDFLKARRIARAWTVGQLSYRTGIRRERLETLERGTSRQSALRAECFRLASFLCVSADEMLRAASGEGLC